MSKTAAKKSTKTKTTPYEVAVGPKSLYRALSAEGNPSIATVLKDARALGVKLHATTA